MRLHGVIGQTMTRDRQGNREYRVTYRISDCDPLDGPSNALLCPGLPLVGSPYEIGNAFDPWAHCKMDARVSSPLGQETTTDWDAEVTFASGGDGKRCRDQQIDDPLLTPPEVSGGGNKYNTEATNDRFGFPLVNSSWEQIRGASVEFDANRSTIRIKMNVPSFDYVVLAEMMRDHVNMFPIWGFMRRCVKLSATPWQAKFYGNCYKYYELTLEYDTNSATFDRDVLDEGTKVLSGHWDSITGAWTLDNIGGLATPHKPSLTVKTATVGGIPAGTYAWRITAMNDLGETLASDEAVRTLAAFSAPTTGYIVTLNWPRTIGATAYQVYWGASGATKLIAKVDILPPAKFPQTTFVDDGGAHPGAGNPPTANTTGGVKPDRRNPAHFIRFKDRNGENARVVLNGAGLPATQMLRFQDFTYYVSIIGANTGRPLTDTAAWLPVEGPPDPARWDDTTTYVPGNLINTLTGGTYICILSNTNHDPDLAANNGTPPTKPWFRLTLDESLDIAIPSHSRGTYDITETYGIGDYVSAVSNAGTNHIEYYDEADFSLLGIPLVL